MDWIIVVLSAIAAGALIGGGGFLVLIETGHIDGAHTFASLVIAWFALVVYAMAAVIGGFYLQAQKLFHGDDLGGYVIVSLIIGVLYGICCASVAQEN